MKLDLERAEKTLSGIKCDADYCPGTQWKLINVLNGLALIECLNDDGRCKFHLITIIPKTLEPRDKLSFTSEDNGIRLYLNSTKTQTKFIPRSPKDFVTEKGISASEFAEQWKLDLTQLVDCLKQCYELKVNVNYPHSNS